LALAAIDAAGAAERRQGVSEVYQIGIVVRRTQSTVITVRVRAESQVEAEKKAMESAQRCADADEMITAARESDHIWTDPTYEIEGVDTDKWPIGEYHADIDESAEGR
jgi:hypothetical protein